MNKRQILRAVANHFDVTIRRMLSRDRHDDVAWARFTYWECLYRLKAHRSGYGLGDHWGYGARIAAGSALGRCPSTVYYGRIEFHKRMESDPQFRKRVEPLLEALTGTQPTNANES